MQKQTVAPFAVFDDYRPTMIIAVAVRWLLLFAWFAINNYRVELDPTWLAFNLMGISLGGLNAYVTWRIVQRQPVSWHHALAMSISDLSVITAALFIRDGFQNEFYVFYYPALLGFSLLFPGRPSFGVLTIVIALYSIMAFTISPTLDTDSEQEKLLFVRLITMVGMVAAGTLITDWERSRRREAVAAERQRAQENLELQQKAQESELAAVEERSRISREIHDGVAQSIYMLSLQLETCVDLAQEERQELRERLEKLVSLSKESLLEVRHYIFDLKPYLAGEKGLVSMVENQVSEFNKVTGVPAVLNTKREEHPMPVPVSTSIYRVTQEAPANIFKHAQATQVNILLEFQGSGVQLTVKDNGQGFDPKAPASGNGLRNMRQRAEELGGSFSLDSVSGQGTQVLINLPCQS